MPDKPESFVLLRKSRYFIMNGASDTELIDNVNLLMKAGWKPVGGVIFAPSTRGGREVGMLMQAMVRDISMEEEEASSNAAIKAVEEKQEGELRSE
jgi:hypothetical protein